MKVVSLLTIALVTVFTGLYGQDDCEVCKLAEKKIDTVSLSVFKLPEKQSPMIHINMLDFRADTSKIGYFEKKGLRRSGKEDARLFFPYQLESGTAKGLSDIFSARFFSGHPKNKEIHITGILKTFWIYEYDNLTEEKGLAKISKKRNKLIFKADYFLVQGDKLFPLIRIDTALLDKAADIDDKEHVFEQFLQLHDKKLNEVVLEKVLSRNSYSIDFIKSKQVSTDHPVLATDVVYKKGIYKTFEEFLSNNPSLPFKEIKEEKNADMLYTETENGSIQVVRDVWGFSDGKNLFTKLGYNFFQLVKVGRTFELLGYTHLSSNSVNNYYGQPVDSNTSAVLSLLVTDFSSHTKLKSFFFPMQIDMQNGVIHGR